jgi:hypothetical protein
MIDPQSLDCPFLIAPSVFSNVYLARVTRRVSLDEQQLTYTSEANEFTPEFLWSSCSSIFIFYLMLC